jgi:acyl carrier protein
LPDHLVPRDIRFLAAFPLTPNGKVDRLALARTAAAPTPAPAPVAAGTAEQRVMEAWAEVLGRAPADPAANFFDLGATSIHLAVVHAKLRTAFQRDFPLTELFAHPTVRALAAFLAPDSAPAPWPAAPAGRPADRARLQQQAFARFRKPLTR